jgi:hypothetical protein
MNQILEMLLERNREINGWLQKQPWLERYLFPYTGPYTSALLIGAVLVLVFCLWRLTRRHKSQSKSARATARQAPSESSAPPQPAAVSDGKATHREIQDEDILQFFLNLYKEQIGAPLTVEAEWERLETSGYDSSSTYELRVRQGEDWASRRMTMAPVGDESSSRSRCYYVIFDTHLVIKIPGKPIADLETYVAALESDHEIVKRLESRECIVPAASALLRLIHPFTEENHLTQEQLEEKYLERLRKYPRFQSFLKIGPSFVFVMDLSRYFFLSHIIQDFHELTKRLHDEIVGYPDVVWENHGFEGRYAVENDQQVEAIRNVFSDFEKHAVPLIKKFDSRANRYAMQKWFLIYLAGRQVDGEEKFLTPELARKVNELLTKVFRKHAAVIEAYLTTIRGCIQTVTVSQNRQRLSGLEAKLLELLAELRRSGVAIRDLKPDNLLVAGDRSKYPDFLDTLENYTLGLIDVETASVFSDESGKARQPLLGGTPSYATPSHLIPNQTLQDCFVDVGRILHLQDWYAVIGILYAVATGERLFHQSGKMIIGFKSVLTRNKDDRRVQGEIFKKSSRMFWYGAKSEFSQRIREKEEVLKRIKITIPETAVEMFQAELQKERKYLQRDIREYVANQTVFRKAQTCKALAASSRSKITQLKVKWKKEHGPRSHGLEILQRLEDLKMEDEKLVELNKLFAREGLQMTAYDLLVFMFHLVFDAMYRKQWGELLPAEVVGVRNDEEPSTVESTV